MLHLCYKCVTNVLSSTVVESLKCVGHGYVPKSLTVGGSAGCY
jgi:hypothetical protein